MFDRIHLWSHLVLSILCPRNTNSLVVALAPGIFCQIEVHCPNQLWPSGHDEIKSDVNFLQTSIQWTLIHLLAFYTECVNPAPSLSHCCSLSLKINFNCDRSSFNWSVSHLWSMEIITIASDNFPLKPNLFVKGHRHWQTRDKLTLHSNTPS